MISAQTAKKKSEFERFIFTSFEKVLMNKLHIFSFKFVTLKAFEYKEMALHVGARVFANTTRRSQSNNHVRFLVSMYHFCGFFPSLKSLLVKERCVTVCFKKHENSTTNKIPYSKHIK